MRIESYLLFTVILRALIIAMIVSSTVRRSSNKIAFVKRLFWELEGRLPQARALSGCTPAHFRDRLRRQQVSDLAMCQSRNKTEIIQTIPQH